jgi:hypothetical protein
MKQLIKEAIREKVLEFLREKYIGHVVYDELINRDLVIIKIDSEADGILVGFEFREKPRMKRYQSMYDMFDEMANYGIDVIYYKYYRIGQTRHTFRYNP